MTSKSGGKDSLASSFITKIGSTTSIVVSGTFFAALSYKRDAFMLTFFIGSIMNGITSKILKKVLNIDRPDGHIHDSSVKIKPSDKGMPSSHAMSLGFICTYTALEAFQILGIGLKSGIIATVLVFYAAISLVYRVKSKLHTADQVYVGLAAGVLNSFIWRSMAFGTNRFLYSINVMEWVSKNIIPENGVMPVYYLIVPALVGAMVVGSVERRISAWLKNNGKYD
jgi:membrane-associated phospholipid phosphatase